ncbi:MAG: hypothetical protein ACLQFT_16375 [Steroidobacteraceae bacterium]|jgi:hypothetical protein
MTHIKGIPIVPDSAPRSGDKYLTPPGFTAMRDGIKRAGDADPRGLGRGARGSPKAVDRALPLAVVVSTAK